MAKFPKHRFLPMRGHVLISGVFSWLTLLVLRFLAMAFDSSYHIIPSAGSYVSSYFTIAKSIIIGSPHFVRFRHFLYADPLAVVPVAGSLRLRPVVQSRL